MMRTKHVERYKAWILRLPRLPRALITATLFAFVMAPGTFLLAGPGNEDVALVVLGGMTLFAVIAVFFIDVSPHSQGGHPTGEREDRAWVVE